MNKNTNYFLWLVAIIFFVSCTEEGEDLKPDNVNPDTKRSTLTFLVDGTDSTEITQKAGKTATFVAVINYGDEKPDNLVLLTNDKEIQKHSLANTPATMKIFYDIPADTTVSEIILTAELQKESSTLVSEKFTVNVSTDDTDDLVINVDTASITLQVDGIDSERTTQTAGEAVTFTVTIDYGDTGADQLVVTNANNGDKVKEVSLATKPAFVNISYDIDDNTAVSDIVLDIKLLQQDEQIDSDIFTITVEEKEEPVLTVSAIIEGESNFSIFAQALAQTGLADDLKEEGPFTVFAPTDAAFETYMKDLGIERNELLARSDLTDMLRYHIVEGKLLTSEIENGQTVKNLLDLDLTFGVDNDDFSVNGTTLDSVDVVASNGMVHIVGELLSALSEISVYDAVSIVIPTSDQESSTFYSTSENKVYSYNEVISTSQDISARVDFGYFYGATQEATIVSPSHWPEALGYEMQAWSTLNETIFRPVTSNFTTESFDNVYRSTKSQIKKEFDAAGPNNEAQNITSLQINSIFTFRTADGRYGILRVEEINGGGFSVGDNIVLSIKVETKQ